MNITKNGLPVTSEEEEEIRQLIEKGAELQVRMEKMYAIMDELGISDMDDATEEQMIALSERMFGKK